MTYKACRKEKGIIMIKKWLLPAAIAGLTLLSACGNGASGKTEEKSAVSTEAAKEGEKAEESAAKVEDSTYAVSEDALSFTAKNLNLEDVDDSIFKDKDLTILNVWGTFCGPCINEMPELGAWAKEMPENVQIIGLVADISGETDTKQIETAKTILEKTDADFQNIIPNEDFVPLLSTVVGVPTTYFINSEGKIVGKPIVGAQVSKYKSFVEGYLATLS